MSRTLKLWKGTVHSENGDQYVTLVNFGGDSKALAKDHLLHVFRDMFPRATGRVTSLHLVGHFSQSDPLPCFELHSQTHIDVHVE